MHAINQKGEGKGGMIFGFTILAITIFLAWKIVPIMLRVYAYQDKVTEECKYVGRRTLQDLANDLVKDATQNDLPVTLDDIEISRVANTLKANVNYTVPIDLAVYTYQWNVSIIYDAPIFE